MRADDLKSMEMIGQDPKSGFPILGHYRIMAMGLSGLGRLFKDLSQSLGAGKMNVLLSRFGYDARNHHRNRVQPGQEAAALQGYLEGIL